MSNKKPKELIEFEPGSKQPYILFMIVTVIISAIIIIVTLISSGLSLEADDKFELGDINGDGVVDSADVSMIMNHLNGTSKLSDNLIERADINADKKIDSNDAYYLIQYVNKNAEQNGTPPITDFSEVVNQSTTTSQDTTNQADDSTGAQATQEAEPQELLLSGKSYRCAFLTGENQVYYSARVVNRWQSSGSANMYQIEFKIKNNSQKTIYNTSANVSFTSPVALESSNGCSVKDSENGFIVRTNNEGSVKPGGTFTCSFIVSSVQEVDISEISK